MDRSGISLFAIGSSQFHIVGLGHDASSVKKQEGLTSACFFVSELVSVKRSNGQITIAQIKTLYPEFAILALGNGLEKQIPASDIPLTISKIIGSLCLTSLAVYVPGGIPSKVPLNIGETNLFPMVLGQNCNNLNRCNGLQIGCYFEGEAVGVLCSDLNIICGLVSSVTEQYLFVQFGDGGIRTEKIKASEVNRKVFKFGDLHYITSDSVVLPTIKVGRTTFSGKYLGDDVSLMNRTKCFHCRDFWVSEPVAVKVKGCRILGTVLSINQDSTLAVQTKDGCVQISAGDVAEVCKVERSLYVADAGSPVPIVFDASTGTVKVGRSELHMLRLGQPTWERHGECSTASPFRPGEAVSVERGHGQFEAAEVAAVQPDGSLLINLHGGQRHIPPLAQPGQLSTIIRTLRGSCYIADFAPSAPSARGPAPVRFARSTCRWFERAKLAYLRRLRLLRRPPVD